MCTFGERHHIAVLAIGRRRRVGEAVEIVGVEESGKVGRSIAHVSAEVARHDEVVDLDGRLADDVVRNVGRKRRARKHFL